MMQCILRSEHGQKKCFFFKTYSLIRADITSVNFDIFLLLMWESVVGKCNRSSDASLETVLLK